MHDIIEGLMHIGAVTLNFETPYIWASGIRAPIYCDNRKTLGHYALRVRIAQALTASIRSHYPEVELIGGTATAGIPHATSIADRMELPLVYFRTTSKDHGTQGKIEGDYTPGMKVVIVEDLISTGGSVLDAVRVAREAGMDVLGVISIFNYQLQSAVDHFAEADVRWVSLLGLDELAEHLDLDVAKQAFIERWRQDPFDTSIWPS